MRRIRCRFSGSPAPEGRIRGIISAADRGLFEPFCHMASATFRRTTALSDIGTLIMFASSMIASLAALLVGGGVSASGVSIFVFSAWFDVSVDITIREWSGQFSLLGVCMLVT